MDQRNQTIHLSNIRPVSRPRSLRVGSLPTAAVRFEASRALYPLPFGCQLGKKAPVFCVTFPTSFPVRPTRTALPRPTARHAFTIGSTIGKIQSQAAKSPINAVNRAEKCTRPPPTVKHNSHDCSRAPNHVENLFGLLAPQMPKPRPKPLKTTLIPPARLAPKSRQTHEKPAHARRIPHPAGRFPPPTKTRQHPTAHKLQTGTTAAPSPTTRTAPTPADPKLAGLPTPRFPGTPPPGPPIPAPRRPVQPLSTPPGPVPQPSARGHPTQTDCQTTPAPAATNARPTQARCTTDDVHR